MILHEPHITLSQKVAGKNYDGFKYIIVINNNSHTKIHSTYNVNASGNNHIEKHGGNYTD